MGTLVLVGALALAEPLGASECRVLMRASTAPAPLYRLQGDAVPESRHLGPATVEVRSGPVSRWAAWVDGERLWVAAKHVGEAGSCVDWVPPERTALGQELARFARRNPAPGRAPFVAGASGADLAALERAVRDPRAQRVPWVALGPSPGLTMGEALTSEVVGGRARCAVHLTRSDGVWTLDPAGGWCVPVARPLPPSPAQSAGDALAAAVLAGWGAGLVASTFVLPVDDRRGLTDPAYLALPIAAVPAASAGAALGAGRGDNARAGIYTLVTGAVSVGLLALAGVPGADGEPAAPGLLVPGVIGLAAAPVAGAIGAAHR